MNDAQIAELKHLQFRAAGDLTYAEALRFVEEFYSLLAERALLVAVAEAAEKLEEELPQRCIGEWANKYNVRQALAAWRAARDGGKETT